MARGTATAQQFDTDLDEIQLAAALERTWRDPPGLYGWLATTDHKRIGKRFIVTAFVFFVLGGLAAAAMRLQLARPESDLIGPDLYNQLFNDARHDAATAARRRPRPDCRNAYRRAGPGSASCSRP